MTVEIPTWSFFMKKCVTVAEHMACAKKIHLRIHQILSKSKMSQWHVGEHNMVRQHFCESI